MQRYIITYAMAAAMAVGLITVMYNASQFDYRYVNKCNDLGGEATNVGNTWRCTKDGQLIIVGE